MGALPLKRASKLPTKQAASKKPHLKESSKKLKRKVARAELAALVERFSIIAERLEQTVDRLAPAGTRLTHMNQHSEHADDVEVGGVIREE